MSIQHVFFAAVLGLLGTSGHAATPLYQPVVHVTEMADPARARRMEVWLWGPGEAAGGHSLVGGNSVFESVVGREGRRFAPGRHPLLVMFHGTSGNTRSIAWLAAALAARGYLVVAANHPGSTSLQVSQESMMRSWLQAEDGRFLIDTLLRSDDFASLIDGDRIGSIGFSLGGYSALAIAGARLRIRDLQDFCEDRPGEETCKLFPDALYGPLVEGEPQNRELADPRIRAAVSLAPGYVPAMDPASLSSIDMPVMIVTGSQDEMLPVGHHARLLAGRLPHGEYVELSDASHFSFLGLCKPDALAILREEDAEFLCDDPDGATRESIHERTLRYVIGFLDTSFGRNESLSMESP